jgi:hypothetical protein
MSLSDTTVWVFLAIFVMSAVIALASLPEWISIGEYYKKKLFQLLILEVIGCVVGFGAASVRAILSPPPASPIDLRSVLLSGNSGWEFQDAQKEQMTRFGFKPGPERTVTFIGETYKFDGYPREPKLVDRWLAGTIPTRVIDVAPSVPEEDVTASPVPVPLGAPSMTFEAIKSSWDVWHERSDEKVTITLYLDTAIRATVAYPGSTRELTLRLTPGSPK